MAKGNMRLGGGGRFAKVAKAAGGGKSCWRWQKLGRRDESKNV